jgi:hypothetical protein
MSRESEFAVGAVEAYFPSWLAQHRVVEEIDIWAKGNNPIPMTSVEASPEERALMSLSTTPYGPMILNTSAQTLRVVGYRGEETLEQSPLWRLVWQANKMDAAQTPLWRDALGHGVAFQSVLPGVVAFTGEKTVKIRSHSALRMSAWYDEENPDFPIVAMRCDRTEPVEGSPYYSVTLYDEQNIYYLTCDVTGEKVTYIDHKLHGIGYTPIVRFQVNPDTDGMVTGEISPFIPILARLDQTMYDRLLVQRQASWRVRFATGLAAPKTDAERVAARAVLGKADLMILENENAKIGTLEPSSISELIQAGESDKRDLATVSQIPPDRLLGTVAQMQPESLASAEKALMNKLDAHASTFGEALELEFNLAAHILGMNNLITVDSQVRWAPRQAGSLTQAADAYGKMAVQLGIPVEMLWEKLENWSDQDTQRARKIIEEKQGVAAILAAQASEQAQQEATATAKANAAAQPPAAEKPPASS